MQTNTRWALQFWAASVAGILLLIVIAWGLEGFDSLGLQFHAMIALGLGIAFTVIIGTGLMTLLFYSARSGQDDAGDFRGPPRGP